jgi:hypothetical protein
MLGWPREATCRSSTRLGLGWDRAVNLIRTLTVAVAKIRATVSTAGESEQLLLDPGGLQGLGSARVLLDPADLSLLHREHPEEVSVDPPGRRTPSKTASRYPFDRYDKSSGIDYLLGFDAIFVIWIGQSIEELREFVGSLEGPEAINQDQQDVRVPDLVECRPVSCRPSSEISPHDLHVRLGHRRQYLALCTCRVSGVNHRQVL